MSLSINTYYQNYYNNYDLTSGSTDTSKTVTTTGEKKTTAGTDSASFSDIAKLFFSFDGTDDESVEDYTDTYSPAMIRPVPQPLSNDQMKSLLEEIQTNIGAVDSTTESSTGTDSTLASLQDLLDGYDLTTADSDEISALFQSVQSVPFSWSYTGIGSAESTQTQQAEGIPSMLQAMGGFPPPFAWGLGKTNGSTDDDSAAVNSVSSVQTAGLTSLEDSLTTEDIQSILANLQSSLSLIGASNETSASTDNPLAAVKAMLDNSNFMTATGSELSSLFSSVLQTLE